MLTRITAIGLGLVVLAVVAMGVGLNPRAEAYIEDVCCDGTKVYDDPQTECPGGRYKNPSAGVDYCKGSGEGEPSCKGKDMTERETAYAGGYHCYMNLSH